MTLLIAKNKINSKPKLKYPNPIQGVPERTVGRKPICTQKNGWGNRRPFFLWTNRFSAYRSFGDALYWLTSRSKSKKAMILIFHSLSLSLSRIHFFLNGILFRSLSIVFLCRWWGVLQNPRTIRFAIVLVLVGMCIHTSVRSADQLYSMHPRELLSHSHLPPLILLSYSYLPLIIFHSLFYPTLNCIFVNHGSDMGGWREYGINLADATHQSWSAPWSVYTTLHIHGAP